MTTNSPRENLPINFSNETPIVSAALEAIRRYVNETKSDVAFSALLAARATLDDDKPVAQDATQVH